MSLNTYLELQVVLEVLVSNRLLKYSLNNITRRSFSDYVKNKIIKDIVFNNVTVEHVESEKWTSCTPGRPGGPGGPGGPGCPEAPPESNCPKEETDITVMNSL